MCSWIARAAVLSLAFAVCARIVAAQTVCPPQFDQRYHFTSSDPRDVVIDLERDVGAQMSFVWPALGQDTDSALLLLNLKGAPTGPVTIRLASTGLVSEQTLAAASVGTRALNASVFTKLAAGTRVQIKITNGDLGSGQAILSAFANHIPKDKKILVVAPHPDDAEIAAFGFYAEHKSTIVTVTAGNAGDFNYCQVAPDPQTHYRMKGRLRVIDSVTVPWQGGVPVSRAFNLGYFDGRLKDMYESPNVATKEVFIDNDDVLPYRVLNQGTLLPIAPRKASWKNLVADLQTVLTRVRPAVVVTPDPRSDAHLDHQFTTVALAQALAKANWRPKILLYTNHADENRYPLGPAEQDLPPPPWCGAEPFLALSFYAFALPLPLQRQKLMALESMHDLRLAPSAQYDFGPNTDSRCQTHPGAALPDDSYFRRGLRSHELFFVTDARGLQNLVAAFLPPKVLPAQQP